MSRYSDKIIRGEVPSDAEWSEHLKEAHKKAPSMTSFAFAAGKTEHGKNSYQLLSDTVPNDVTEIIDLACGDGHLIPYLLPKLTKNGRILGIDMSEGELEVARKSITDPRVTFCLAAAQNLPVETQTTDHIVCHLAFMLMLPVEPVVSEIARVLKPNGFFSAVIGSRAPIGLFSEIQKECFQFIHSRYPKVGEARTGDSKVNSLEGLNALFTTAQAFRQVEALRDFSVEVSTDPEGLWDFMKNMYFIGMLPESEKLELKKRLLSIGQNNLGPSGTISFKFPMKIFRAQRN